MTIILASIIVVESGVIAWLCHKLHEERHLHAHIISGWLISSLQREQEIATLRDEINRQRRNTGKAEM